MYYLKMKEDEYCAAALGTALRGAVAVRFASGTLPASAATATAFGLSAASPGLNFPLFFILFPFSGDFWIFISTNGL